MNAYEIYENLKDMDFMDYEDTYNEDIEYIAGMIARVGVEKTLAILGGDN
jgi:tetrahydromethanopterin S-methyltransferase subunit F